MPDAYIIDRDGREILMRTVPEGQHDAATVAAEMAQVAQRAYDLGRSAEGAALERAISETMQKVRSNQP